MCGEGGDHPHSPCWAILSSLGEGPLGDSRDSRGRSPGNTHSAPPSLRGTLVGPECFSLLPQASVCKAAIPPSRLRGFALSGERENLHTYTPDAPRMSTVCEPEGCARSRRPTALAPPLTHPVRTGFHFNPLPPGPGAALHMGQAQLCTHGLHMRQRGGPCAAGLVACASPDHLPHTPTTLAPLPHTLPDLSPPPPLWLSSPTPHDPFLIERTVGQTK